MSVSVGDHVGKKPSSCIGKVPWCISMNHCYIILVQVEKKPIEGKIALFFSDKMEAEQVFIKTEEEYEEERDVATQFLPEETPRPGPVKSER